MESKKKLGIATRLKQTATGVRAILCALLIPLLFGAKAQEVQANPQPADISFSETGEVVFSDYFSGTKPETGDPPVGNNNCGR